MPRRNLAFQPVQKPAVPVTKDRSWIKTPVDSFILAKLEEKGLRPAPPADKLTLLRRVTFDLTGLPPSEEEVKSFMADHSPKAYEKAVDRLLALAAFTASNGAATGWTSRVTPIPPATMKTIAIPMPGAIATMSLKRSTTICPTISSSVNRSPATCFPQAHPGELNRRGIVATGFLALGAKALAQKDRTKMFYDVYDEQVDVVSRAMMGVTLACARCHDISSIRS